MTSYSRNVEIGQRMWMKIKKYLKDKLRLVVFYSVDNSIFFCPYVITHTCREL